MLIVHIINALKCEEGYVNNEKLGKCVACDPGQYHNKDYNMCLPCMFGEYSYKRASTNCVKCHKKYSSTHLMLGSVSCNHSELIKRGVEIGTNIRKKVEKMISYVTNLIY